MRALCMRCHEKDKYAKIDKINLCALICWAFSIRELAVCAPRNVIRRGKVFRFGCRRRSALDGAKFASFALSLKWLACVVRSLHFCFGQVMSSHSRSCELRQTWISYYIFFLLIRSAPVTFFTMSLLHEIAVSNFHESLQRVGVSLECIQYDFSLAQTHSVPINTGQDRG